MMIEMKDEELKKLKRENVEACLNCKNFLKCKHVGKYVECEDFEEVEGEAWVIRKI